MLAGVRESVVGLPPHPELRATPAGGLRQRRSLAVLAYRAVRWLRCRRTEHRIRDWWTKIREKLRDWWRATTLLETAEGGLIENCWCEQAAGISTAMPLEPGADRNRVLGAACLLPRTLAPSGGRFSIPSTSNLTAAASTGFGSADSRSASLPLGSASSRFACHPISRSGILRGPGRLRPALPRTPQPSQLPAVGIHFVSDAIHALPPMRSIRAACLPSSHISPAASSAASASSGPQSSAA